MIERGVIARWIFASTSGPRSRSRHSKRRLRSAQQGNWLQYQRVWSRDVDRTIVLYAEISRMIVPGGVRV